LLTAEKGIIVAEARLKNAREGFRLVNRKYAEGQASLIEFIDARTTLTAIGGLLPIALGNSNLYSPLAFVIIGGLITSTLLARLVTPVMYKLLPPEIL
jgi:Cu/Ag efflux pump CusA